MTILIAEDDKGQALLIQRNLKRAGIQNNMVHVKDGREAMDFILAEAQFVGRPPCAPLLVLLDIHMPRMDGVEVLTLIKSEERTKTIPVIMLTTTEDPMEIERCYRLGCNLYLTKPVEAESFSESLQSLGQFLKCVSLPA